MIPALYFAFVPAAVLTALSNWRLGLLLMLVAGALQDPVRKLMPDAPGWMVLGFLPVLVAVLANAYLSHDNPWRTLMRIYPTLRVRFQFFAASLLLAFLVLFLNYGPAAWKVAIIGAIGYLFPLLAVALGFAFTRTSADLLRFIRWYCAITSVLLVGGLLEHWQVFPEWPALGTRALDMVWIRHVPGYIVQLTSGFYRSPDLLGWHAGLLVMFSLLMSSYTSRPGNRAVWLLLAVWGITMLLVSGRNKMIFMPPIFVVTVGLAYLYKGHASKSLAAVVTGLLGVGLFLAVNQQLRLDREYIDYVGVGSQTASERLKSHGLVAVITTLRQSGFFGEGLGSASTGSRYGGSEEIQTWQESGPSKVMVELGVIGFVAGILLTISLLRCLWRGLKRMPPDARDGALYVGMLGVIAANGASFIVSHQAFGDPFLVTLAGFLVGIGLSAPRWAFATSGGNGEPLGQAT